MTRAFVVVLDACGVGELPDAADYGDAGSNTLAHLAEAVGGLDLLHSWREASLPALVLALSSGNSEDAIACLDAGADACVASPPSLPELLAQVLPALDRAYLRPRHNGYLHFQDKAGPVVQQALQGKLKATEALRQMHKLYNDSRQ